MLSPEDKRAILDFAGPLFHESRAIDSSFFDGTRPKVEGVPEYGLANGIKSVLERELAPAQRQYQQPPQQYLTPPSLPPEHIPQHQAAPPPQAPQRVEDSNQLELNFNPSAQSVTNDLLKENNRILRQILKQLEEMTTKENQKPENENSIRKNS
jgi:hypothetical protein